MSKKLQSLKPLTTFGVEATASRYLCFETEREITDHLAAHPLNKENYLVLGGGSNLLFTQDFDGVVLHPLLKGMEILKESRDMVWIKVMTGESWDDFVAWTVAKGWGGIENLSLIPGHVGASAVQNIGAYGW